MRKFFVWLLLGFSSFYLGVALAASPFTWNITAPANNDPVINFPPLDRADKTVIGGAPSATSGILGTLTPYGTANTGWRENQVNDDSWLCQNAFYTSATVANRDSTSFSVLCLTEEVSGPYFRWQFSANAANPITFTEWLRLTATTLQPGIDATTALGTSSLRFTTGNFSSTIRSGSLLDVNGKVFITQVATASAVDAITLTNAATANPATVSIAASGTDANINLNLQSKGTGTVQLNGTLINSVIIPVSQTFTVSGTYVTPANARFLVVYAVGASGGGGGGGSCPAGCNNGGNGGNGGDSAFSDGSVTYITGGGGVGGQGGQGAAPGSNGSGGVASSLFGIIGSLNNGTGVSTTYNVPNQFTSFTSTGGTGGAGGSSAPGGIGGQGGAGALSVGDIYTPTGSYTVTIGAAGTAGANSGSGSANGVAGVAGKIIVWAF